MGNVGIATGPPLTSLSPLAPRPDCPPLSLAQSQCALLLASIVSVVKSFECSWPYTNRTPAGLCLQGPIAVSFTARGPCWYDLGKMETLCRGALEAVQEERRTPASSAKGAPSGPASSGPGQTASASSASRRDARLDDFIVGLGNWHWVNGTPVPTRCVCKPR